jgi:hypothetical protein
MPERLLVSERTAGIWSFRGYGFGDLESLARSGATTAVVDTLAGEDLSRIQLLVILARDPADLTPADVSLIRAYRESGGQVADAQSVDGAYRLGAQWVAPGNAAEYFFSAAYATRNAGPISAFGLPRLSNSFVVVGPTELLAYGGTSRDPPSEMHAWLLLPSALGVEQYDTGGELLGSRSMVGPGLVALPTRRHAFAVLPKDPAARAEAGHTPASLNADRAFGQTGFAVVDATIWDYFTHRGGINTFGYPVSRAFVFEGMKTQFFQRRIVQLDASGRPRVLNLLDPGLMPYRSFGGAQLPGVDPTLVAAAPNPTDGRAVLQFVRAHVPDALAGRPVGFFRTFSGSVPLTTAFPGGGDPSLLAGFALELWGIPTSAPTIDPTNHNFVYQRFQRGIMHYDAGCGCTQGVLLGDAFKSILTGEGLPPGLEDEARNSPYYKQYDPSQPRWVRDAGKLPNTDLTNAFTPG